MNAASRVRNAFLTPITGALVVFGGWLAVGGDDARAYTPASPEVVDMVQAGLKHLETCGDHYQVGGEALIGMTLVKNGYDANHPRVAKALLKVTKEPLKDQSNYNLGLAVIFLCDLDPQKYRKNIEAYLKEIYKRQQAQGNVWTYTGNPLGDTSQTQYGVLALWTAYRHGIDEDEIVQRAAKACNWLIRTQDPSGMWGYHAEDPKSYNRIPQNRDDYMSISTTAAGLGTLYVCGDILGLSAVPADELLLAGDLPALVPVIEPRSITARTEAVDRQYLARAQRDGNRWMHANYKIFFVKWPYYYLYALERYQSFREIAEGRKDDSPVWYNDGVKLLSEKQTKSGAFQTSSSVGTDLATCFAILFLTRSTKKTLGLLSEGTLRGGIGLPSNESKMSLHGGRIVAADVSKTLGELLSLLEDQETAELNDLINFSSDLEVVVDDPDAYQEQLKNLRQMASHTSYHVRHSAIRVLAKTRDLDNVPTLIFALSDPDLRVAREAEKGLKFVSRKLDGFDLPDADPTERTTAIVSWKQWYLSIRPDAVFSD